MATMKTLNGYGFNATEFNGKTSDSYLLKTDTASDSAKLGGKAPKYYIQPRNLLDNSDFRNLVNQRGITSETSVPAYSYFIDRWINQTSEARSFTLSTSGIGLPLVTTLLQKIEKIEAGKIVTFAIKLSDGTIATLTGTVQYTSDGSWTRFASISHSFGDMYMDTMNGFVNVVVYSSEAITIEWAALYEGSYTADTLPPYVPKGYAAELAECQRYYFKGNGNYRVSYPAFCNSETVARATITLPTEMRITPTVTISDLTKVRVFVNGTIITPTALSATAKIANNVMLEFKISGGAVNYGAVVRFGDTITLEFSADL